MIIGRPGAKREFSRSYLRRCNIDSLRKLMYERMKAIHLARYPYEKDLLWQEWMVE
jgi:hypothetical protein